MVHVSPEQGFLEAEKIMGEGFSFSDLQATYTSRKTQLSFDSSHFIDVCCFTSFPLTQDSYETLLQNEEYHHTISSETWEQHAFNQRVQEINWR